MDLGFLFDRVMRHDVPLAASAVVASQKRRVVVSSPARVSAVTLEPARTVDELYQQLRASCHVPLLAGRSPFVGHERLFDGSLTEPIPVGSALASGATHVLVLSSTSPSSARPRQSVAENVVSRLYDRRYPGIHAVIAGQVRQSGELRRQLQEWTLDPAGIPHVLELAPLQVHSPDPLCCDADQLERAHDAAVELVRTTFAQ